MKATEKRAKRFQVALLAAVVGGSLTAKGVAAGLPPADLLQAQHAEEDFGVALTVASHAPSIGAATIRITPKGVYKVNPDYPTKFTFEPSAMVVPKKDTLKRGDIVWKGRTAELGTVLAVKSPGRHEIAGLLKFSICNEEKCVTKKRRLSAPLTSDSSP